jgi:hypothetical protein
MNRLTTSLPGILINTGNGGMAQLTGKIDLDAVVLDSADYFDSPMDVIRDSRFTHDEKRRILESWALDAQLLSQAEAENMPGPKRSRLSEVKLALLELQHPH